MVPKKGVCGAIEVLRYEAYTCRKASKDVLGCTLGLSCDQNEADSRAQTLREEWNAFHFYNFYVVNACCNRININMKKYLASLILAVMLATTQAAHSEHSLIGNEIIQTIIHPAGYTITLEKDVEGESLIRFSGRVGMHFDTVMSTMIRINVDEISYIELSSNGGIMNEIIDAGNLIRKHEIPIVIRSGESCISACAFLSLYSPDIRIKGQLAFHMPYLEEYSRTESLYEISQKNIPITLYMVRTMYRNGWGIILHFLISINTTIETYVVFESTEELNLFRIENLGAFDTENTARPFISFVRKSADMARRRFEQKTFDNSTH